MMAQRLKHRTYGIVSQHGIFCSSGSMDLCSTYIFSSLRIGGVWQSRKVELWVGQLQFRTLWLEVVQNGQMTNWKAECSQPWKGKYTWLWLTETPWYKVHGVSSKCKVLSICEDDKMSWGTKTRVDYTWAYQKVAPSQHWTVNLMVLCYWSCSLSANWSTS